MVNDHYEALSEYEHIKKLIAYYKKHALGEHSYKAKVEVYAQEHYSKISCEMLAEDDYGLMYPIPYDVDEFVEAVSSLFNSIFKRHILSRINVFLGSEYQFKGESFALQHYNHHHGHLKDTYMVYTALNNFFIKEMQMYLEPLSLREIFDSNELNKQELRLVRNYTPITNEQLMKVHAIPHLSPGEVLP